MFQLNSLLFTLLLSQELVVIQLSLCKVVLPLYIPSAFSLQNVLKVEGSRSRLLENSLATACICAFSYLSVPHSCCCWFIWKVFDEFVNVYLCIMYILPLVAFAFIMFALSISFTLMIFVLVAFFYC